MEVKLEGKVVRGSAGAAGFDLVAAESVHILAGDRALVKTGVRLEMPAYVCALVVPRSGLALKHGISVLNAPGLVDPDFRGEVGVILVNHSNKAFSVSPGDRIAQLLFVPFVAPTFIEGELSETARGAGGFGSSGA
jgi:dUTP pyrophosphatase